MRKSHKRGSIITESAITLPIFILAVVIMNSVILMYACIENCSFIAANEFRKGAAEAIFSDSAILIPHRIRSTVTENYSQIKDTRIRDYGYRSERWGQDELIIMTLRMKLEAPNPIGIKAAARYDLSLVTRAYVGKIQDSNCMTDDEFAGIDSNPVYIFPARGERYHGAGCQFLKAVFKSATLDNSIRAQYRSCPLCKSGSLSNGASIEYFPAAGEAFHTSGCPSLKRKYIEIDKKDATKRGYTPCSKCGGE